MKNVGPIRYSEPFYIVIHQGSLVATAATVARRLRIDVHDDDDDDDNDYDNAWQSGPLWPHRMSRKTIYAPKLGFLGNFDH